MWQEYTALVLTAFGLFSWFEKFCKNSRIEFVIPPPSISASIGEISNLQVSESNLPVSGQIDKSTLLLFTEIISLSSGLILERIMLGKAAVGLNFRCAFSTSLYTPFRLENTQSSPISSELALHRKSSAVLTCCPAVAPSTCRSLDSIAEGNAYTLTERAFPTKEEILSSRIKRLSLRSIPISVPSMLRDNILLVVGRWVLSMCSCSSFFRKALKMRGVPLELEEISSSKPDTMISRIFL
mmetsp:Transcript_1748/g.10769  ORF Transcript_1748/g.10769 Transcript_1748/m.10769 type:complete len:240 (-) Transcript_1748:740-1459(-)